MSAYLHIAERHGFAPAVAHAVYRTIEMLVTTQGYGKIWYGYRRNVPQGGEMTTLTSPPEQGERALVVFPSPDAALALAQRYRIQPTPRLFSLHLSQLLAIMLERPAIRSLLFSDDAMQGIQRTPRWFHKSAHPWEYLPIRFRLDRAVLLHMLKG